MRLALELRPGVCVCVFWQVERTLFFVAEYSKGNYFTMDVKKSVHHFCDLPRNVQSRELLTGIVIMLL